MTSLTALRSLPLHLLIGQLYKQTVRTEPLSSVAVNQFVSTFLMDVGMDGKRPRASRIADLAAAVFVWETSPARASLEACHAAIAADAAGVLQPVATLTSAVTLTESGGEPFNFGANSGDMTMEFIVDGDMSANINSHLAVGENTGSNLRHEGWNNTGQVGSTQLGVADYFFTAPVPSCTWPTHLAYIWNATALSVTLCVHGSLAGTTSDISDTFAMPTGQGFGAKRLLRASGRDVPASPRWCAESSATPRS